MDPIPRSRAAPHERGDTRARRLVRVKFMALPMDAPAPAPRFSLFAFICRVLGRVAAARP
jgi:hypothetical protein